MEQVDGPTNIFVEIVVSNAKDYGVAVDKYNQNKIWS